MGSVTQDDLLDALRKALGTPEYGEGQTAPEIADILGVHHIKARDAIRKMLADGTMETVSVRRQKMNGLWTTIIGYRLKPCP